MAKKKFTSESKLEQYLTTDLQKFLSDQLAPKVKQILIKHINEDVYNDYSPIMYQRRGMLASGAYIQSSVDGFTLTVKDMTPGNFPIGQGHKPAGNQLMQIIETGAQGHGYGKWPMAYPRPATTNAQTEIDTSDLVKHELKKKYKEAKST